MINAILRSAGVLVLLASGVHAADWRDQPPPGPYARRAPAADYVNLLPDCQETQQTDLLRCAPRAEADPDAFSVVVRRKSVTVYPRKPYPQLFQWDAP